MNHIRVEFKVDKDEYVTKLDKVKCFLKSLNVVQTNLIR